jgi:prepilin-type N-terminal cleavage/methylation domain-containing protein
MKNLLQYFAKHSKLRKSKPSAFSLIELSVVITIVALITAATLSLNVSSANSNKVKITNERIKAIYDAMGMYLAKNAKLPCVAPINLAKTNSSYGIAGDCTTTPSSGSGYWISNTFSTIYYGMVPVQTLNLPVDTAEDGWGSKFAYVVLKGSTNASKFWNLGDSDNRVGGTRVGAYKKIGSTVSIITTDALFAIISYGPNKYGAWNARNTTQNSASSLTEETWNYVTGNIDNPAGKADFYSYDGSSIYPFITSYGGSTLDDIIFYKSRDEIIQDFKLFHLVYCLAALDTYFFPTSAYGEYQQPSSGTTCTSHAVGPLYPAKRCGLLGNWETYITWDCTT